MQSLGQPPVPVGVPPEVDFGRPSVVLDGSTSRVTVGNFPGL
jgi:hypothetical protein